MNQRVIKRNGRVQSFSSEKLMSSIHLALRRMKKHDTRLEEAITNDAISRLKRKRVINTEDIRKAVCASFKKHGHHNVCDFYSLVWLHAKPVRVKYVIKRHGSRERFSPEKLFKSMQKAFNQAGIRDGALLQKACLDALAVINKKYHDKAIESSTIRDMVEYTLVRKNLNGVAKRYIMHRYM